MLRWILSCGHHVALERLLALNPVDSSSVPDLPASRLSQMLAGWTEGKHRKWPLEWAVLKGRDVRTIELLVVHMGVVVSWDVARKAAIKGEVALFEAMVRREEEYPSSLTYEKGGLELALERDQGTLAQLFHVACTHGRSLLCDWAFCFLFDTAAHTRRGKSG